MTADFLVKTNLSRYFSRSNVLEQEMINKKCYYKCCSYDR